MDISVSGSDYASIVNQTQSTGLQNKINNMENKQDATDEEMMAACKEFEAYMVEQIYKGMQKTVMKAEEDGDYEEYFGDMLTQEYAKLASPQGVGLAEQLYESMKNNYAVNIKPED